MNDITKQMAELAVEVPEEKKDEVQKTPVQTPEDLGIEAAVQADSEGLK